MLLGSSRPADGGWSKNKKRKRGPNVLICTVWSINFAHRSARWPVLAVLSLKAYFGVTERLNCVDALKFLWSMTYMNTALREQILFRDAKLSNMCFSSDFPFRVSLKATFCILLWASLLQSRASNPYLLIVTSESIEASRCETLTRHKHWITTTKLYFVPIALWRAFLSLAVAISVQNWAFECIYI